jgi:hypothetical protein
LVYTRRRARLDAARSIQDLRVPPGNRLHALGGDRKGQWALWINDQFRICSVWGAIGAEDGEIVDDHCVEPGREDQMTARDYSKLVTPLPHSGEHLREDFLPDFGLTAGSFANAMGLRDRTRIERLVRKAQPVTPDTALGWPECSEHAPISG